LCPLVVAGAAGGGVPVAPLDAVQPGMVLRGESVFGAAGLEPFDATVLATMRDYVGPGEDVILVRLSGAAMDRYGVVSGMSGSPVYLDGRLVGAVAYRFGAFPKEPMAGVTPAESMLAILRDRAAGKRRLGRASLPPLSDGRVGVPIETPLVCGGCPDEVLTAYGPRLAELGMTPVRGSASASQEAFPVFPGGPIAGALVEGDVSMMALGTVTYVNGDDVLAFGHPFLGMGSVELPMASAQVHATIASLSGSHKLGRAGKVVGVLLDDRLSAIAGKLGGVARTVPVALTVDRPGEMDARKTVSFRVVDDVGLGGTLVDLAMGSALTSRVGFEQVGSVRVKGRVVLEGGRDLALDRLFSAVPPRSPTFQATNLVGDVLEELWRNAFERVRFKGVEVTISHHPEPAVGVVGRVAVEQTRVRAGRPLRVVVEVRTHRQGVKRLEAEFPTERAMEPGFYTVHVADREEALELDKDASLRKVPASLGDVVEELRRARRQDRLYAYLLDRVSGARVGGVPMAELPPSMMAILTAGQDGAAAKRQGRKALQVLELDPGAVVTGHGQVSVEVLPPRDG
jgi:hypothetical protein